MGTSRDALLERYRAAAASIEGHHDRHTSSGSGTAASLEDLLRRQARRLTRGLGVDEAGPLLARLDDVASAAMTRFYAYRYDRVPHRWRHLYTDTLVLVSYVHLLGESQGSGDPWTPLVENLDRALITTGGASSSLGDGWIERTISLLEDVLAEQRPAKRQRTAGAARQPDDEDLFSTAEPYGRPTLSAKHTCPRHSRWTLDRFETHMARCDGRPRPVVLTDVIDHWPALTDRPWQSRGYLLSRTLGGRRLVPVEVGRSYVDRDWGQELIPFGAFVERYIAGHGAQAVGYLAQHDLLRQVPALRNDVLTPDLCWADVPPHPLGDSVSVPGPVDAPQLNAWFGPARTITPLHTDGYHNLLCQVVGTKYVRLYPAWAGAEAIRPRGPEGGIDMSNTSGLDVGVLEGWDPPGPEEDEHVLRQAREALGEVEYYECILGPGDTLLIPMGWWHYVRSLSVSFSVSFWWN